MSYKGTFKSFKNESYEVSFITSDASELPLEFGTSPFIVTYQGDDDIYKPLKLSGATVNIYTDSHKFDLYTGNVKGVKCIFKGYGQVLWCGYVTPCLYSQDAYEQHFYLSVECVDALSVLENIKYTQIGEQKSIQSFSDVLSHCLKQTGYELSVNNKSSFNLTDKYILEANFFDEDGEAWTCKEVLEEILGFCNLTAILVGETVYIVDWDEVDNLVEAGDGIVYTGSTLSLSEVYNSISIESDTYAMESIVPSIGGNDTLITSKANYHYNNYPKSHDEKIEMLSHPRIKTTFYAADGALKVEPKEDGSNWNTNWGAIYFRPSYWNFEDSSESEATTECLVGFKNVYTYKTAPIFVDKYNGVQASDLHTGLSWATIGESSDEVGRHRTVLTMKSDGDVVVGGGWTCIEAECWANCANIPASITSGSNDVTKITQEKEASAIHLNLNIKVGKYWLHQYPNSHNSFYWSTDAPSTTYNLSLAIGEVKDVQTFEQWHDLMNTQIDGIDSVGYKAYMSDIIIGKMEVNFCLPTKTKMTGDTSKKFKNYHWVLMKSFTIKNAMQKEFADNSGIYIGEEDNSDIVWSTIIDQNYSIEGESISLKLNTPSSNEYCYSDVFFSDDGDKFERLLTIDKGEGEYPAEQYKLNSYYWQNRVPRKVIDLVTDKVMNPIAKYKTPYSEMAFICNSLSIDYAEAKSTLQLIEKESL